MRTFFRENYAETIRAGKVTAATVERAAPEDRSTIVEARELKREMRSSATQTNNAEFATNRRQSSESLNDVRLTSVFTTLCPLPAAQHHKSSRAQAKGQARRRFYNPRQYQRRHFRQRNPRQRRCCEEKR